MNKPIVVNTKYHASAERVWRAITDKEQMKQWYFVIPDFELKTNSIFNFYEPGSEKKFHHRCTIKEIIPNSKFQHTWTYPIRIKGESLVTWEIAQVGEFTYVTLTHEGIENFAEAGSDFARENFVAGWNEIVGTSLRLFLEK
jgi:uncharacterized protein YndB with AHSA1/START domain